MTTSEPLEWCEKCTLRAFSRDKGIVCSLTNNKPNFVDTCPDFSEDERAAKRIELEKTTKAEADKPSVLGMNSGIGGGIVLIALSIAWFVFGLFSMNRIFFYPPVLLVIGIIAIVRGANKQTHKKQLRKKQSQTLDGDLLDD